jgi:putative transposase
MTIDMGIIKLEISIAEATQAVAQFKQDRLKALEVISQEIKNSISNALNQLLNAEMSLFLGNSDQSKNKRNGYYEREYALKGVGCVRVRMPTDRNRKFNSSILPKNEQVDPRLKEDMAVLHLAGLSSRTLSLVSRRLLGVSISSDTVSKSLNLLEEKALNWLTRPLQKKYWALYVDGTNFRIQRRGSTEKEPSLVVLGIDEHHRKSILAIEPGHKDNAESWRQVFRELKNRGLSVSDVEVGIMDGLPGLETVFKEEFPNAVTARCWVHKLVNVLAKVPARLQEPFKQMAHKIMYAESEQAAKEAFITLKEVMLNDAERAVKSLEKDLTSLLVHYRFDPSFWRALKTTNPIERVNKELKRRTKSMDSIGERTLEVLVAFTALRLENSWQMHPVNSGGISNLKQYRQKTNAIESSFEELIH